MNVVSRIIQTSSESTKSRKDRDYAKKFKRKEEIHWWDPNFKNNKMGSRPMYLRMSAFPKHHIIKWHILWCNYGFTVGTHRFIKRNWVFECFAKRGGSDLLHKKGGVAEIGSCFEKRGLSLFCACIKNIKLLNVEYYIYIWVSYTLYFSFLFVP